MTDLREALLALEVVRELAPGLPVFASLTFERKKRGFFTLMGDPLVTSLRTLLDAGAAAAGANCTITSSEMKLLAEEVAAAGCGPLVLQPNAGQPRVEHGRLTYDQRPEEFASDMAPLAGIQAVAALGGCCGTDPRFIATLAQFLKRDRAS